MRGASLLTWKRRRIRFAVLNSLMFETSCQPSCFKLPAGVRGVLQVSECAFLLLFHARIFWLPDDYLLLTVAGPLHPHAGG